MKKKIKEALALIPVAFIGKILTVLVPLALIGMGAWQIYPPASFIVVGIMLWLEIPRSDGGNK